MEKPRRRPEDTKLPRGCWNPLSEMGSREDLKERQFRKLQATVKQAYYISPFYKRKYDEAKVKPEDLKTPDDFRRFPLVTRDELSKAQEDNPVFGDIVGNPELIEGYYQTSGTTRSPLYMGFSWRDCLYGVRIFAYSIWGMGFRPSDFIAPVIGVGLFAGGTLGYESMRLLGIPTLAIAPFDTKTRLGLIMRYQPNTILGATPSYMFSLVKAAEDMGIDLARDTNIQKILCFGEPFFPSVKKYMEEAFGARCCEGIGIQETTGVVAFACPEQTEGEVEIPGVKVASAMHLVEELVYFEVLDPDTLEPCKYGEEGLLVVTPFHGDTQPFVRYRVGDITSLIPYQECGCGRVFDLCSGILGRIDHVVKVRGATFYPYGVEEIITEKYASIAEHQLVLWWDERKARDELTLKLEFKPGIEQEREETIRRLIEELKSTYGLRMEVEVCGVGDLPQSEFKAVRFQDLRPKH